MDVALVLVRDRGERRRFPLGGDVVMIGRGEGCDLRIPLGDVSRKHCSVVQSEGQLLIQDLGSSNGTYVNGKRIQEASLRPGDQIRIGSLRFVVQVDGSPTDEEAVAMQSVAEQTAPEQPAPKARPKRPAEPSGSSEATGDAAEPPADDAEMMSIFEEDDDPNWP